MFVGGNIFLKSGQRRGGNGFHDEKLKGDRAGQRSSRLSLQYRVICKVEKEIVTVCIIDINAHKY